MSGPEIDLTEGLECPPRRGDRVVTTTGVHGIVEGRKDGQVLVLLGVLDRREIREWFTYDTLIFEYHGTPFVATPRKAS